MRNGFAIGVYSNESAMGIAPAILTSGIVLIAILFRKLLGFNEDMIVVFVEYFLN